MIKIAFSSNAGRLICCYLQARRREKGSLEGGFGSVYRHQRLRLLARGLGWYDRALRYNSLYDS